MNSVARQPESSLEDAKILIAEDEVLVRLMLADALRGQGFRVFEAADAEDAISILKAVRVDVVITDLHMRTPSDGMLVARFVREHCPATPVLLAAATRPAIDALAFDALFIKPYRPEDIASWINRHGATPERTKGALP